MKWINDNQAITASNSFANGYHASWADGIDPTTFNWGSQSLLLVDDQAQTGNTAQVFIQRLCATAGMSALDPAQRCSDFPVDNHLGDKGSPGYQAPLPSTVPQPFYRITTRVVGPRNTVSYTQALTQ